VPVWRPDVRVERISAYPQTGTMPWVDGSL
jgi:hypothetical protein